MKTTAFSTKLELKDLVSKLVILEPRFNEIIELVGTPVSRDQGYGFEALFKIIVGQQLSTHAANSIWNKLLESNVVHPKALLLSDDYFLRSKGLSRTKIKYAKGLASANIDYSLLKQMNNDEVVETLCEVKGIGRWSAEIYLIFSLKRTDVFAQGDLALQYAVKNFLNLDYRPSEKETREIAFDWRPYRSVAALLLWKYYNYLKVNKGVSI